MFDIVRHTPGRRVGDLLRMWRESGESASAQAVDWQTAEFAVHTWDLVRATGQSIDLDPRVDGGRLLSVHAGRVPGLCERDVAPP